MRQTLRKFVLASGYSDVFVLEINGCGHKSQAWLLRTFLCLIFEDFCILPWSKVSEVRAVFLCEKRANAVHVCRSILRKTEVTWQMCSWRGAAMQQQVHKCLYMQFISGRWNEIFICFPSVLLDIKDQTTAGVSCSACLFHPYHLTRFRLHQISCNCPPNSVRFRSILWRRHLVSLVCIRNQEEHQTDVGADQPVMFRGTCTACRAAWPGSATKPLTGLFRLWLVLLSPPPVVIHYTSALIAELC